jgi:dTDP-4-dehydrorhamnose 3,5-epimerase
MNGSNILIIGSKGQLGTALSIKYPEATAIDADTLDITDEEKVASFDFSPYKIVINAAAYTNVNGAETSDGRVTAWSVNAKAVMLIAKNIIPKNIIFVHISTDYVFDGTKNDHKEEEALSPLGVYGQSKAAGDFVVSLIPKHYILRTSWVIGEGNNFVRTMLDLGKKGIDPKVIGDVLGRPTFTVELVRAIDFLLNNDVEFGLYNVSNDGDPVSWADFSKKIYELAGMDNVVTEITDEEYYQDKPEAAPRPMNSVFDLSKIHYAGFNSTNWEKDLEDYIKTEIEI